MAFCCHNNHPRRPEIAPAFGEEEDVYDPNQALKIVIVGEFGSGKSCLMHRLRAGEYDPDQEPTIGGAFLPSPTSVLRDASSIRSQEKTDLLPYFELWDTSGQEQFPGSLAPIYYRQADAVIVAYDITYRNSFKRLSYWLGAAQTNGTKPDMVVVVVGTKIDMEKERTVQKVDAEGFARENGDLHLMETSAKTGEGVSEFFAWIANEVHRRRKVI